MKIKVLGSAAGGGFPQWNCNCKNCQSVRAGVPGYQARTQSSIAISDGSENWILVNASPDILTQIKNTPELHAMQVRYQLRHSPELLLRF